jgi:DHA2 family multidrug resistance protein
MLPLLRQRLRGYSVLDSNLIQMPRMLILFVVTPIAGRLYNYVDGRLLIGAGVAMMMLGYFDLAHLTLEVGPAELLPGFLLTGAGMSCMFGTMSAVVMRTVPQPLLTATSGLNTLSKCSAAWSIVTQP